MPTTSKYRKGPLVAEGGTGRIYQAHRVSDGRQVALKILRPHLAGDQRSRQQFLHEAHALSIATHPLVVELIEYGETAAGLPYLVLDWVEGRNLHALLVEKGATLGLTRVARLFGQLLEALEMIHQRGVVHGDLKPENIMVCERDGRERICLIDFGVASISDRPLPITGDVCGTPGYLAPELMGGAPPSPSSDLYAAGVLLFELLTGCAPFCARSLGELMSQQVHQPLPLLADSGRPGVPYLEAVVARALAAAPAARFASATELAEAFHLALDITTRRSVIRARVEHATATPVWHARCTG